MRLILDSAVIVRRESDLQPGDATRAHIVDAFAMPIIRLGGREVPNFSILLGASAEISALSKTLLVTQRARLVWRGIEVIAGVIDGADFDEDSGELTISVVA